VGQADVFFLAHADSVNLNRRVVVWQLKFNDESRGPPAFVVATFGGVRATL